MAKKTIVMNVDYFDEVHIRKEPFGPKDVEELVRRCAKSGVDAIYWRAIGLGVAGYPSKFLQQPGTLIDADMSAFLPRMSEFQSDAKPSASQTTKPGKHFALDVTKVNGYRQHIGDWAKRMAACQELMDPIAEARDACRRHGLQFYIWHDFLDERQNLSLAKHPEWCVTGKDGVTRFPGLRSYAVEEAVADQLAVIGELLAYKPDGLYLCTSCHNRHLNFPEPEDFFGFEAPVVEACRKTMKVDIRNEPFDAQAWHEVKGGFVTSFFKRVKDLCGPIGAKLAIGTQLGRNTILTAPVFSTHVPYRFATQWRRWVDEGIADTLILGDYEWPWDNVPIWEAKKMSWPKGTYAADHEWPVYADYVGDRARLLWFSSWLSAYVAKHKGASSDSLNGALTMRAKSLLASRVGGICLHEAMTFEQEADGFETIAAMRRQLDEGTAKA